ncbi:MAG: hypothetical protein ACTTKL_07695 [Treponema sp.]
MIANAVFKIIEKNAAEYASSYLPNALPAIPSALLISLLVISALPRERTGTAGE